MTRTTISHPTDRGSDAPSTADQALAWIARQVRWEQTLAALRAGRTAEAPSAPARKAA